MKVITESEMNFGEFDESNLFHIENSKIYKDLGDGIKTVEFILKYNEDSIIFLEAKKSCPNAKKRHETEEKERKFEAYFSSLVEKFIASLHIYLASILGRYQDISEVGDSLQSVDGMKNMKLKFVLVIKNAEDVAWLVGPSAELKARLLQIRKIWNIEIMVLNEELAEKLSLTAKNQDYAL